MEWYHALLLIFGIFGVMAALGLPVAFSFLVSILTSYVVFMGPVQGPYMIVLNILDSLASFSMVPIPLFILMGELLFHSGLAFRSISSLGKWMGKAPARLSFLALGGGSLFAALTGSAMANTALLGSLLVPDMRKQGYSKELSYGPILASGGLAMIIPPSTLAVIYGTTAQISIGRLLIAGLVPGLIMAVLYGFMIYLRVRMNPSLAPAYEVERVPIWERTRSLVVDILPLGALIFLVTGLIVLGVATPTESAALGAVGALILVAVYRLLTWKAFYQSVQSTLSLSVMIFMILAGSVAFSKILSYTGVTSAIAGLITGLTVSPYLILLLIMLIVLVLGTFMDQLAIIMVATPLFAPVVAGMGWNPIWFGVLMLINLQMGLTTPPFGMLHFVMKGVAAKDTTMGDLYRSAAPFLLCDSLSLLLIIIFPALALWLPSLMIR